MDALEKYSVAISKSGLQKPAEKLHQLMRDELLSRMMRIGAKINDYSIFDRVNVRVEDLKTVLEKRQASVKVAPIKKWWQFWFDEQEYEFIELLKRFNQLS